MRLPMTAVAAAVRGTLHGDAVECQGATIDSRAAKPGQLFVPIVAARDGHDFVAAAVAEGAAGWLATHDVGVAGSWIEVEHTTTALLDVGRYARSRLRGSVVGVTGSVGKTTVKDLTAEVLRGAYVTHANERSFNNELGVPLTLAGAPDDAEAVVVEMGARGRGHIKLLCDVARPTIGVVTMVALAHAEMFGTVEEVARAKGELVEALPAAGTAVLNGDDPLVAAMAHRTDATVVRFGLGTGMDVTAEHVVLDDRLRARFTLRTPAGTVPVLLRVHGQHQVANALAAAAAGMAAGIDVETIAAGLGRATLSPHRMALLRAESGALVLNDAYNANPTSMAAALQALAALPARRRVAVLGLMAELGPGGPAEHRRMADLAAELGIEVVAVACADYGVAPVADAEAALAAVGRVGEGDAVLVKGSRVASLEVVAEALVE